jgi:hypothetical protein
MLKNEETKNPSAIETYVCKEMEKCDRVEMDKDTCDVFLRLMISRMQNKDRLQSVKEFNIPEKEKPFIVKMLEGRLKMYQFKINDFDLRFFLAVLCKNPGNVVLYLWYLQYWCKKNNVKELDLENFSNRIFPYGFPSEDTLLRIWDGQKVDREGMASDNLVDYGTAGQSLVFEEKTEKV